MGPSESGHREPQSLRGKAQSFSLGLPVEGKRPQQVLKFERRGLAPIEDRLDDVRSEQGEPQHAASHERVRIATGFAIDSKCSIE